jgi:hypothetical protein
LFFAWLGGLLEAGAMMVLWIFLLHGPHYWATLSRTYADRAQRRRRRRLLAWSLLWYAIGPAIVALGLGVRAITGNDDLIKLFFLAAAIWAFQHVAKQHFGFLALYRAKHGEHGRAGLLFHKYYLLASLWLPALILLGNSAWLADLPGIARYVAAGGEPAAAKVLAAGRMLRSGGTALFWGIQALFAAQVVWRLVLRRGVNVPVLLLIAAAVPLNWIVIMTCLDNPGRPAAHLVMVPILTAFHNLQYHGLVWHYHRFRRRQPGVTSAWCNRSHLAYIGVGLAFTAATIGVQHYGIPALAGNGPVAMLFAAFFLGFAFQHYYLDGRIWHARQDAELRQLLGMDGPDARPESAATPARAADAREASRSDDPVPV